MMQSAAQSALPDLMLRTVGFAMDLVFRGLCFKPDMLMTSVLVGHVLSGTAFSVTITLKKKKTHSVLIHFTDTTTLAPGQPADEHGSASAATPSSIIWHGTSPHSWYVYLHQ